MVKLKKYFLLNIIFFYFFIPFFSFGQDSLESLSRKSFKELSANFYKYERDTKRSLRIAKAYLIKAKNTNDSMKIANGYYYILCVTDKNKTIIYCDSILQFTKNKIGPYYPSLAYFTKGDYFYSKNNFYKSLINYLSADSTTTNLPFSYNIKHRIGLIKTRYGKNKEALELFKEVYKYYLDNNFNNTRSSSYFSLLFALSDSYSRNGFIDSSNYFNNKGFLEAFNSKDSVFTNYFRLEQGLLELNSNKYIIAIDSIKRTIPILKKINDASNLAFAYFILGKSYLKINRIKKSILYFKKVDSIFIETKDIHPDLRETYVYLIKHYKKEKKTRKHLEYIEKLLVVDSVLNHNYRVVNNKLIKGFDTPKLLIQRDILISKLNNKVFNSNKTITYFKYFLFLFLFVILYQERKRNNYKKKFTLLINNLESSSDIKTKAKQKNKTSIGAHIIDDILKKLTVFEEKKGYIERNLKITLLANKFKTNGKYLSYVINNYKNKNFSNYINDLRITFIINELKNNKTYTKYTIKAIANEAGFSNPESFSKAFYNKTGIYPSFFIKELKKIS